jgi:hypothetical protein
MKSPNLKKLVNSVTVGSPEPMHEAFTLLMQEKLNKFYDTKVVEVASTFFGINESQEVFSYELSEALEYVLEGLQTLPVSHLTQLVSEASEKFGIGTFDIENALKEAVSEDLVEEETEENMSPIVETFLKTLNTIILENRSAVLPFVNKSARKVTVSEATELAKIYTGLNRTQKNVMAETMIRSRQDFENILGFSLTEARKSASYDTTPFKSYPTKCKDCGKVSCECKDPVKKEELDLTEKAIPFMSPDAGEIHGLLNRYGFKLDHAQTRNAKTAKIYRHFKDGTVVRVGPLDSVASIKNHLADKEKVA